MSLTNRAFRYVATPLAVLALLCAPLGLLKAKDVAKKANTESIIVLQPSDPVPASAERVNSIEIKGTDPTADCSYFEIMETAKEMALKEHANIIKVTKHASKNNACNCDGVSAVLYRTSDDAHAYATEISWSKTRKLDWNDFRGPESADAQDDNTAAATYCGFGFETNVVTNHNKPKIFVYNTFYADKSWVRNDEKRTDILAHEQGHFDLCELYTRKLREAFSKASVTADNLKPILSNIYQTLQQEYVTRQQQYEDDTQHGIDSKQQQRWLAIIDEELHQNEVWMQ